MLFRSKICLITDLHCNIFGVENEILIERIHEMHPDYVMIAGDMVIGDGKKLDIARKFLLTIAEDYPVYYAPGNHELKMSKHLKTKQRYHRFRKRIIKNGIHYLSNETVPIYRGDQFINISGLNLSLRYFNKIWNKPIIPKNLVTRRLGKRDQKTFQILLAHHPDYFENYAKWGADLTLSGHIHGGIMVLPWIGGVIAPSYKLFPKYDFGLFEKGERKMILSRGLGLHTIKIRIFNKPQLIEVQLLRTK